MKYTAPYEYCEYHKDMTGTRLSREGHGKCEIANRNHDTKVVMKKVKTVDSWSRIL